MELFKVMKIKLPISIAEMFVFSKRKSERLMKIPNSSKKRFAENFAFQGSKIWNSCITKVLVNSCVTKNDVVIPGSTFGSDLTTPISVVKRKIKELLFDTQKVVVEGRELEWGPENTLKLS